MREAKGEERIRGHTCLVHDAGAGPLTKLRHHLVPDALLIVHLIVMQRRKIRRGTRRQLNNSETTAKQHETRKEKRESRVMS